VGGDDLPTRRGRGALSTVVRDAPVSVIDKLAPSSRTPRALPFKPMARSLQPAKRVIGGSASMLVRVDPLK